MESASSSQPWKLDLVLKRMHLLGAPKAHLVESVECLGYRILRYERVLLDQPCVPCMCGGVDGLGGLADLVCKCGQLHGGWIGNWDGKFCSLMKVALNLASLCQNTCPRPP